MSSPYGWIADAARAAYCETQNFAQSVGALVLRGDASQLLGANPCSPAPPPPSTPQFPVPSCTGGGTEWFIRYRYGDPVNEEDARGDRTGYITGIGWTDSFPSAPGVPGHYLDLALNQGGSVRMAISTFGSNVPIQVLEYYTVPLPGTVCDPPPGSIPAEPPPPETTPPTEIIPPPPASQQPFNVNFTFYTPIFLPGSVQIQIPVTAHINPTLNIQPTINIPFTLDLPDLNADFSFAFNPHFSLIDLSNTLENWPPEGIPPGETLEPQQCPPLPLETERRIVGVRVYCDQMRPPALTTVPSGVDNQLDGLFPRFATVLFRNDRSGFSWGRSLVQSSTRYGYVPCPWPEGADQVIVQFEPGLTGYYVEHYEYVPVWKEMQGD